MSTRTTGSQKTMRHDSPRNGQQKVKSSPAKPRRFVFGPGLFLAVLASIAVWAFMPRQQPGPPKVAPSIVDSTTVPSAPEPGWLLQQRNTLGLTPAQTAKLERLKARWDRDTGGLRQELDAATADLQRQMPGQPGKGLSVQEIQRQAAPMAALSREMANSRQAWWSEARQVLTPEQRATAEADWANQWSKRGTTR